LYREWAGAEKSERERELDRWRHSRYDNLTKPPYFGGTIALWGLYSAVIPSALNVHWAAE